MAKAFRDQGSRAERSRRGYDRLAPVYAGLEALAFGNALKNARTALLSALPPLRTALVLGEGDGRLLPALLTAQARCRVSCVEQSPRMLERAHRRLADDGTLDRVDFILQDARTFCPVKGRYDAIFTTFFLDCFEEAALRRVIPLWLGGLKAQGHWYFADFRQPERGLAALRAKAYLELMHAFFRWQTDLEPRRLTDPHAVFLQNGLRLVLERRASHGLLTTRLYRLNG